MSGPGVIPKYPKEWLRFIRAPARYVDFARTSDDPKVYEPWAAFVLGLGINTAFAAYEAHRWEGVLDKGTEQAFLFIVAVLNLLIVHGVCRMMDGKASAADMTAAFEYLYGFLTPLIAVSMTAMMAFTALFPGVACHLGLDTFECNFAPMIRNIVLVSAVQTVFFGLGIYVLVVFNAVIARIHGLSKGKVAMAQVIGLFFLALAANVIHAFAHGLATQFKDVIGVFGG